MSRTLDDLLQGLKRAPSGAARESIYRSVGAGFGPGFAQALRNAWDAHEAEKALREQQKQNG